ncbi:PQQ-binding-like beta-propeller repeat protein [Methanosarcina sp. Z-7115]|uniref:PQQ-binding-like beta-propeller repeat protein n=1 Tax=Methanosarcina baikalica TaxID=3073890 RepID=A0ABU2D250_9EURY|nr:PQQ-binding-like beta-propeller repeat protein [Methanosarcina sp. Z-7115]MDR7666011.1 PQQ-binding-like beta-propeller repeat protein [Methanosarcina sp. Z-7115]
MKKSSVVLIIIVSFICLVCSGCISSHIVASEEKENSSGEISKSDGDQASNQLNQENIHSSEKSSPYLYWEYELGDITPENLSEGKSNIQDCVTYSQDGMYVAVGTGENLEVIDVPDKKVLWKKTLRGNVSDISFSKDGKYLLAGERSNDGYIYSLDAGTGDEIHSYRSADDLGTSTNPKYQPCIYKITAADDEVYIAAGRYWKDSGYGLASRVYRFSPDGTLSWKLPETENYARSINWIDSSRDGRNVVFSTGDWTNSLELDAVVYSVDESGKLRWKYEIPSLKPYFDSAAIWHGLDVSDDGSMVTAYTGDGRRYLFYDSEMKNPGDGRTAWDSNEWQYNVTAPEEIQGSYIYTYGEDAKISTENETLYLTGATLPAYYPNDIPMAHPLENSLVSCDVETGDCSWTYNLWGRCTGIFFSPDMRFFVLPVGKDTSASNTQVHGIHAFDNQKSGNGNSKLLWTFNTEGVVVDAAISSSCTVAAVEAPLKLQNGDVIGKHRLIIVR